MHWKVIPGTPGHPRVPRRKRKCSKDPFLMVLEYFWCPLWLPFPHCLTQCFIVCSGSFEDVSKTRFVLISAPFSDVFLWYSVCLLERGGQSDICTPFDEKQRFFDGLRPSIFICFRHLWKARLPDLTFPDLLRILRSTGPPFWTSWAVFPTLLFRQSFWSSNGAGRRRATPMGEAAGTKVVSGACPPVIYIYTHTLPDW